MKKTVYVIGAGASCEVDLPSGHHLKKEISNLLDFEFDTWGRRVQKGDVQIFSALEKIATEQNDTNKINRYVEESRYISKTLPLAISIDNLIDNHRDNTLISECSKLSIIKSILMAEGKSKLFFSENEEMNFSKLEDTWYLKFFQIITEQKTINELESLLDNIVLIVFNYDRCIEHFLFNAFKKLYKLKNDEAGNLVEIINIYHPYGFVGKLPWQDYQKCVDFGYNPRSITDLYQASTKIKTFTESINDEDSNIINIRKHISDCDNLIFLGFAFHNLNLELLQEKEQGEKKTTLNCYGTAFGISDENIEIIEHEITRIFKRNNYSVTLINESCSNFFTRYNRLLQSSRPY